MEKIQLEKVNPKRAATVMHAAGVVDPCRQFSAAQIAQRGTAFELTTARGTGVFVVEKRSKQLWIHGAGGVASRGLTGVGLHVIEAMAEQAECGAVAFQTGRPGLVRLARKQGYRVVGFLMEKKI